MNTIAQIGNKIFEVQRKIGLNNFAFFQAGLSEDKLMTTLRPLMLEKDNELFRLYSWTNGAMTGQNIAMKHLWLMPGYFLLPSNEMIEVNRLLSNFMPTYCANHYPLTSSGSAADYHFINPRKANNGYMPVYIEAPEDDIIGMQIYDTIELMLTTVLHCYEEGIFFIGNDGCLEGDVKKEILVSREYNPRSNYWHLNDLF